MIKSIKLNNFQSHISSFIFFDEHITAIIGNSDSGKSSIIRALKWVIDNRPSGDDFIRYNSDDCIVEVDINNHIIKRIKSKNINQYILDNKIFTGFGLSVPDEIRDIFNFSEFNFQFQFDPPFLISNSASDVSRFLNKCINFEKIDLSLTNIESMKRDCKREMKYIQDEYDLKKEKCDSLQWVYNAENTFNIIENRYILLEKNRYTFNSVHSLYLQQKKVISELQFLSFFKKDTFSIIVDKNDKVREKRMKYKTLIELVQKIKEIRNKLNILPNIDQESVTSIFKKIEYLYKKSVHYTELTHLIKKYKNTQTHIKNYNEDFKRVSDEFKSIPNNICPVCGKGL